MALNSLLVTFQCPWISCSTSFSLHIFIYTRLCLTIYWSNIIERDISIKAFNLKLIGNRCRCPTNIWSNISISSKSMWNFNQLDIHHQVGISDPFFMCAHGLFIDLVLTGCLSSFPTKFPAFKCIFVGLSLKGIKCLFLAWRSWFEMQENPSFLVKLLWPTYPARTNITIFFATPTACLFAVPLHDNLFSLRQFCNFGDET